MKPKQKNFQDWQRQFLSTLQRDEQTGNLYARIEFSDYLDLYSTISNLTEAISYISLLDIDNQSETRNQLFSIHKLSELLSKLLPFDEMQGLDELKEYLPPECME